MISALTHAFVADLKALPPSVALLRMARSCRVYGVGDARSRLLANRALQSHLRTVAKDDTLFYLAHRHYLVKGLTAAQRADVALVHYEHETHAFDDAYHRAVYDSPGLVLWAHTFEDTQFEIRLTPGNDVMYEGGVSVVLYCNNVRVCVISYSTVPASLALPTLKAPDDAVCLFITRKQLSPHHSYQKVFNRAFERTTPGHLCLGALSGIALVQGMDHVIGISPEVHPAMKPGMEAFFQAAYTDFWLSLQGRPESPLGYVVPMPMHLTPLDQLDAKARKRALVRRRHIDDAREGAMAIISRHLVSPTARSGAVPASQAD